MITPVLSNVLVTDLIEQRHAAATHERRCSEARATRQSWTFWKGWRRVPVTMEPHAAPRLAAATDAVATP